MWKQVALCLTLSSLYCQTEPKWVYKEVVDGNAVQTEWFSKPLDNMIELEGISPKTKTQITCSNDYIINKITYESHKGKTPKEYSCKRDGSALKISSHSEDHQIEKIYQIGKSAWIQEFGFGLRPFVQSGYKSYKFCIINPKDYSLNQMVAKKERVELIDVNDKTYKAQKVKITLQGFKSLFWTAYAWFDTASGDLLMYRGNKGPNTPTSVITLSSSSGQSETK